MNNYILRVRPYPSYYDEDKGITQQNFFARRLNEWFEQYDHRSICVWSQMELLDGSILCVFEHARSGFCPDYFQSEFDKLFKYTDGYELEVVNDDKK